MEALKEIAQPKRKCKLQFPTALRERLIAECGFTLEEKTILNLRADGLSIIEIADGEAGMKDKIKAYKEKLESAISEYMASPSTERTYQAVHGMVDCWEAIDSMEQCLCRAGKFTRDDAEAWNAKMLNDDGTTGGHWTIAQTTAVAQSIGVKFDHISDYCWNVAMNMMYSDYCTVANKYNVGTPEFYACMAKAFLFDKDAKSPNAKMAAYYFGIVDVE